MRPHRSTGLLLGLCAASAVACGSRTAVLLPVVDSGTPDVSASPSSGSSSGGAVLDAALDSSGEGVGDASCPGCAAACMASRCLVALAPTTSPVWALAVDDTNVYWTVNGTSFGAVMEVPVAGGAAVTLASGAINPWAIATDPTGVYWVDDESLHSGCDGCAVIRMPPGGVPTTLASPTSAPQGVAVSAGSVFFTLNAASGGVFKEPVSGGALATLATTDGAYAIAVRGGTVYWTQPPDTLWSTPVDGGASVQLVTGTMLGYNLAVDSTSVYWVDSARVDGHVMRIPRTGGTPVTMASGQVAPFGIASDGTNLYWSNNGDADAGSIVTMPVAGGPPVTLAANLSSPEAIAVDATSIYWVDDTAVWKLTPK